MSTKLSYDRLMFEALREVSYVPGDSKNLTNESLVKAMTLNENLSALGYTLNPRDLIAIATSPSLDGFYKKIDNMVGKVNAKPMYPDFPKQVMNMSEAQFRMHQLAHYASTYGMEALFGVHVDKGWLPSEKDGITDTEKTESDTKLLKDKVIALVPEEEKYTKPMSHILAKKERMTDMEREIVAVAVKNVEVDYLKTLKIPFKENMETLFMQICNSELERDHKVAALKNICQHPGDVLRFTEKYLDDHRFKLTTAQKKLFTKLFDLYPAKSFEENLVPSRKMGERNRVILQAISYANNGRNRENVKAAANIKNMMSWMGHVENKLKNHDNDVLNFIAQRPGMMLRMTSRLLREGYSAGDIKRAMLPHASELSTQTMATTICKALGNQHSSFGAPKLTYKSSAKEIAKSAAFTDKNNQRIASADRVAPGVVEILKDVMQEKMRTVETELKGKKVYLDETGFCYEATEANPGDKSLTAGYVPSSVAYEIPEDAKTIRLFVYWNDKARVDIDLHTNAVKKDGSPVHVGWNGNFYKDGIVFSGDITHSNAAEYIDIDLTANTVKYAEATVHVFSAPGGKFSNIDTCFVGMMAVNELNEQVKLYDPKNCFMSQNVECDASTYTLGYIDVEKRKLYFIGEPSKEWERGVMPKVPDPKKTMFSIKEYLDMLSVAQGFEFVDSPEKADKILTMCKPASEKEISLIDNNFFYDAKPVQQEREKTKEIIKTEIDFDDGPELSR